MTQLPAARVELSVDADPAAVWAVLSDGWSYASWVVGASRVRAVDLEWPAAGTRLAHSFGPWPLVINDHTEVLECLPGEKLVLQAKGWPTGEATVVITTPAQGAGTLLQIEEDVTAGPALVVPKPLRQLATIPRNKETLRRLGLIAAGRAAGS